MSVMCNYYGMKMPTPDINQWEDEGGMVDTHPRKQLPKVREMKGFPMIEIKLPTRLIGLGFRHPSTLIPLSDEAIHKNGPTHRKLRSTVCQVYELFHTDTHIKPIATLLAEGEAVCGLITISEQFNKEKGRKIALTRALKKTDLTKYERSIVWDMYRGR